MYEERNSFDPCATRHAALQENEQAQHFFAKLEGIQSQAVVLLTKSPSKNSVIVHHQSQKLQRR